MQVTIKDIAQKVGVSPSTVSRALNGNSRISEETTKKIQKVMEELDYHPNSQARSLVNGNTYYIGLVIDAQDATTFANAFFNRSVFAIEKVLQEQGYTLLILNDGINKNVSTVEKLVLERKVDGLILPSSIIRPELIDQLNKLDFPFVIMGEPEHCKDISMWIDIDNEQGSANAVSYLLEKKYKSIVFISDSESTLFARKRIQGYWNQLKKSNADLKGAHVYSCIGDPSESYQLVEEALRENPDTDAFICGNNMIAFHVLQALKDKKMKVPEEVGVVAFDNYPIAEYTDPPLTVIDVDTYDLGTQAARKVIQKIEKESMKFTHTLIPTKLIERLSTKRGGV